MNVPNIKALAEIMTAHGLTSLEVSDGQTQTMIRLEKTPAESSVAALAPAAAPAVQAATASDMPAQESQQFDFNQLNEVKSPMVGVFYSAPSPDADPYVSIGSKVQKGDVLCIIEAMKLMNEIVAEADGEIADICMRNGDIVEYGQVLFKLF
jgi:acetyl-CoA carboxylase biotin carboxyl carrier protein